MAEIHRSTTLEREADPAWAAAEEEEEALQACARGGASFGAALVNAVASAALR
jgi:hypothetical protein